MPEQRETYQDIFVTELKKDSDEYKQNALKFKRELSEALVLVERLK